MRDANELRAALDAGPVLGFWAAIPSSVTAEVAAATGAGYVVVDQQHGAAGPAETTAMLQGIRAAGAAGLVRVPRNDPWLIGHPLDLGALGVIVPDGGERRGGGAGRRRVPLRAGRRALDRPAARRPGRRRAAVRRDGRDARRRWSAWRRSRRRRASTASTSARPTSRSATGTSRARGSTYPPVVEGIERVRAACAEHGIVCGLHCLDATDAARYAATGGFGLVTVGHDLRHLRAALEGALATARGE